MPAERWDINWDEVGLGTRPDNAIAQELGVCSTTVSGHRRKLGIAPFGRIPKSPGASSHGFYWLGLFPVDGYRCRVCSEPGATQAAFLLRGHVLALELCKAHGDAVQRWAAEHHSGVVPEILDALYAPSGVVRELGYASARSAH